MFVTRSSLRGLTQLCGTFSIHAALLVTILVYYPGTGNESIELKENAEAIGDFDEVYLRRLMIATHTILIISTYCLAQNYFEGIIQQIMSYTAVVLYIFMISAVVKEIYCMPTIEVLFTDLNALMRFIFLSFEYITFVGIVAGNALYLSVRMLTKNEVNIIKAEPKK